ncbi:hypothetical protein [Sphingomonas sp.]|uniref:hypothetical protein n=1 Tax=Sphingomonas sp. TaxID=28214 RepID=UPI001B22BD6C|nr:hypothetical protein [Sphingomonas sp.]MBO9714383.1 hypothetical protein [Sphingomonas sp.]
MKLLDLWLVGFGLRCGALVFAELAAFAYLIPTLFNLHSDLADVGAALVAMLALAGGFLTGTALTREFANVFRDKDS